MPQTNEYTADPASVAKDNLRNNKLIETQNKTEKTNRATEHKKLFVPIKDRNM